MDLDDIRNLALTNKQYIRNKVSEFMNSFEFLDDLPKMYFISSFKVKEPEDRAKMKAIDFNERLIEIPVNINNIFYYDYVEKKMYDPVGFFFALIKRGSFFPDLRKLYNQCVESYNEENPNISVFDLKGLRQLLVDAHEYKLSITFDDYKALIKGFEDTHSITEEEFNGYKDDVVGDYVVENAVKLLGAGTKKTFADLLRKK